MIDINTESNVEELQTKNNGGKEKTQGKNSISDYKLKNTNNGKLMVDFYIVVLNAINNNSKGKKMVYNGILITVELAKSANDWLTNNCFGEPSARDKPQEKESEPGREEMIAEIKRISNEAGLKLVDINSPSSEESF